MEKSTFPTGYVSPLWQEVTHAFGLGAMTATKKWSTTRKSRNKLIHAMNGNPLSTKQNAALRAHTTQVQFNQDNPKRAGSKAWEA